MSSRILLESGTNELEILEFTLSGQSYGLNVAKVCEIMPYESTVVTAMPKLYQSILGMFVLRESTLPLIDLRIHLDLKLDSDRSQEVVMVCEFNDMTHGFLVDSVVQIHRCSWNDISPLSVYIVQYQPSITSSLSIDNKNILLIDLEYVLSDIYPNLQVSADTIVDEIDDSDDKIQQRASKRVVFADDSPIVRASIKSLAEAKGYSDIKYFDNGQDAFNYIKKISDTAQKENRELSDFIDIVVTDIEMPKMDGLTMCKNIKEDPDISNLPVVIFSSLVNDSMIERCKSVRADDYASKANLQELINLLDRELLQTDDDKSFAIK
ncbi:MAG: chemotaxis protein [Nitrospinota bacterium]